MDKVFEIESIKFYKAQIKQGDRLMIIWNRGGQTSIEIDGMDFPLDHNCILFISEFHKVINVDFEEARIIYFDKSFLYSTEASALLADYLMLFYGTHFIERLPKITLTDEEFDIYNHIWKSIEGEYKSINDPTSKALIENSLKRFLILSERIHMNTEFDLQMDLKDLKVIRQFQFLLESNFKELNKVSDYAEILMISPKKISQIFNCCYHQKASEVIARRRNLYAQNQLKHTDELIKNIAYDLNFADSQSFSHFFKKNNDLTPDQFRKKHQKES